MNAYKRGLQTCSIYLIFEILTEHRALIFTAPKPAIAGLMAAPNKEPFSDMDLDE